MHEKPEKSELEIVSVASNEPVPAPEVEQKKKKKGWTLFRSSKSKSEENAKKEISTIDDPTKVKIISVKPKNPIEDDGTENPDEIQADDVKKTEEVTNGERCNDAEVQKVEQLEDDDHKQPEDDAVPKKKWYQWFGRSSIKKNKTQDVPNAESPVNETDMAKTDTLPADAGPSNEAQKDVSMESPEPEKRKRLTLNFFRRSTKKNKKSKEVSPTETVIEEIEIRLPKDEKAEKTEDIKVEPVEDIEAENSEIPKSDELPAEDNKFVTEEPPAETQPSTDAPKDDQPEQSEDVTGAKRKRFTFMNFFRRSTRDEKSPEKTPVTENTPLDIEFNENEPEKTEDDNKVGGTITIEATIECVPKNAYTDDESPTEDVSSDNIAEKSEIPIGDNANVGDVQKIDGPNDGENKPIDDTAEKSVTLIAESSMKEIEQK